MKLISRNFLTKIYTLFVQRVAQESLVLSDRAWPHLFFRRGKAIKH